jgi:hypothetical protein
MTDLQDPNQPIPYLASIRFQSVFSPLPLFDTPAGFNPIDDIKFESGLIYKKPGSASLYWYTIDDGEIDLTSVDPGVGNLPIDRIEDGTAAGDFISWTGVSWQSANLNLSARLINNGVTTALDLAQQGATPGQVLRWDGAAWTPGDVTLALVDTIFTLQKNTDITSFIRFSAAQVATGVTRVFTAPDSDGIFPARFGGNTNVFLGVLQKDASATTGNTAVGYLAGENINTNTTQNTSVGHQALQNLTTGDNNTVIGYNSGLNLANGSSNFIAASSIPSLTGGSNNILLLATSALNTINNSISIGQTVTESNASFWRITSLRELTNNQLLQYNAITGEVTRSTLQTSQLPEVTNAKLATEDAVSGDFKKFIGASWQNATIQASDVPSLSASKITTDVFNVDRIPSILNNKLASPTADGGNNAIDRQFKVWSTGLAQWTNRVLETADLAADIITTLQIVNDAVTLGKLAHPGTPATNRQVTIWNSAGTEWVNRILETDDLAADIITTLQITNDAVTLDKFAHPGVPATNRQFIAWDSVGAAWVSRVIAVEDLPTYVGSAAGGSREIQFNNSNVLSASSTFVFSTTGQLGIGKLLADVNALIHVGYDGAADAVMKFDLATIGQNAYVKVKNDDELCIGNATSGLPIVLECLSRDIGNNKFGIMFRDLDANNVFFHSNIINTYVRSNLGIGIAEPVFNLDVVGNGRFSQDVSIGSCSRYFSTTANNSVPGSYVCLRVNLVTASNIFIKFWMGKTGGSNYQYIEGFLSARGHSSLVSIVSWTYTEKLNSTNIFLAPKVYTDTLGNVYIGFDDLLGDQTCYWGARISPRFGNDGSPLFYYTITALPGGTTDVPFTNITDNANLGTGSYNFIQNGVNRLRVHTDGRIGVNTVTPLDLLHVDSSAICNFRVSSSNDSDNTVGIKIQTNFNHTSRRGQVLSFIDNNSSVAGNFAWTIGKPYNTSSFMIAYQAVANHVSVNTVVSPVGASNIPFILTSTGKFALGGIAQIDIPANPTLTVYNSTNAEIARFYSNQANPFISIQTHNANYGSLQCTTTGTTSFNVESINRNLKVIANGASSEIQFDTNNSTRMKVRNRGFLELVEDTPDYRTVSGGVLPTKYSAAKENINLIIERARHWRTSAVTPGVSLQYICWSAELKIFVAVGAVSPYSLWSEDGINWRNPESVIPVGDYRAVCWSAKAGRFVAIRLTTPAAANTNIITSVDGKSWSSVGVSGVAADIGWHAICYSNELSKFLAVAYNGSTTTNWAIQSTDGLTWDASGVTYESTQLWQGVCWSPELAMFVACGTAGASDSRVAYSFDGKTWTKGTGIGGFAYHAACWANDLGRFFVSVRTGDGSPRVITSRNGINWETTGTTIPQSPVIGVRDIRYFREIGLLCVVSLDGDAERRIHVSADGFTWYSALSGTSLGTNFMSVEYSPELDAIVAVGGAGVGVISQSKFRIQTVKAGYENLSGPMLATRTTKMSDGAAKKIAQYWRVTSGDGFTVSNNWTSVCWSGELERFVIVGSSGVTNERIIRSSTGGEGWSIASTGLTDVPWQGVCWSPERSIYVAVGNSGSSNTLQRIVRSSDGANWSDSASIPALIAWQNVCWAREIGKFCAVGQTDGTAVQRIITSSDGSNWVASTLVPATIAWRGICWSGELGLFVAVGIDGSITNRIMYSRDGLIWTAASRVTGDTQWRSVCWAPELGKFCAVGNTGTTTGRIATSTDGRNWVPATNISETREWFSVCWASELCIFVIVASNSASANSSILNSRDGLNWFQSISVPNNMNLLSVCWAAELGAFLTVGNLGGSPPARNRVMLTDFQYRYPSTKSVFRAFNVFNRGLVPLTAETFNGREAAVFLGGNNGTILTLCGTSSNSQSGLWFKRNDSTTILSRIQYDSTDASLDLNIQETSRLRIKGGNVGISETNPQRTLDVNGTTQSVAYQIKSVAPYQSRAGPVLASKKFAPKISYDVAKNIAETWELQFEIGNVTRTFSGIAWSPKLEIFIGVSTTGATANTRVRRSVDGYTWSDSSSGLPTIPWNDVIWVPELSIFVIVGTSATTTERIRYSSNGTTWTAPAVVDTDCTTLVSVCWSPELNLLVAVGTDGTTNRRVLYSSNGGANWTSSILSGFGTIVPRGVCWSPELGLFVAVGNTTATRYSVDGISWNNATAMASGDWRSVCWSAELGIFVAISETAAANNTAYSSNGINWVEVPLPGIYNWRQVRWLAELGIFIAVSSTGSPINNRVVHSIDGINWLPYVTGVANAEWQSIGWSPELMRIVIGSNTDPSSRIVSTYKPLYPNIRLVDSSLSYPLNLSNRSAGDTSITINIRNLFGLIFITTPTFTATPNHAVNPVSTNALPSEFRPSSTISAITTAALRIAMVRITSSGIIQFYVSDFSSPSIITNQSTSTTWSPASISFLRG